MSTYLFTFRAPPGYAPSAATFATAAGLARGCPLLDAVGGVEICELRSHDEGFAQWLDTVGTDHD
jgi:hypothetical protein